jgi:hypothetical protein
MKIEKTNEEITSIRKTTQTDFTLTNSKGESKEIQIVNYTCDDGNCNYENEETILDMSVGKYGEDITDLMEWLEKFEPEADADDLLDEIREKITI